MLGRQNNPFFVNRKLEVQALDVTEFLRSGLVATKSVSDIQ